MEYEVQLITLHYDLMFISISISAPDIRIRINTLSFKPHFPDSNPEGRKEMVRLLVYMYIMFIFSLSRTKADKYTINRSFPFVYFVVKFAIQQILRNFKKSTTPKSSNSSDTTCTCHESYYYFKCKLTP